METFQKALKKIQTFGDQVEGISVFGNLKILHRTESLTMISAFDFHQDKLKIIEISLKRFIIVNCW